MNNAYPCPACGASANLGTGCTGCGRPPHPGAAEVIRLDREIVVLDGEVARARQAYDGLVARLAALRQRRNDVAAAVRAEFPPRPVIPAPGPAATPAPRPAVVSVPPPSAGAPGVGRSSIAVAPIAVPPVAAPPTGGWTPVPAAEGPGGAETSTRTVQGLLFVLGGLLLGTAATVFTAVAWASVGLAGRALILLAFTVLLLAVPLLARRRGLRGTAETLAAVGLLLVVLDGYAAWTVDLFGVTGWPGSRYAALVAAVSTAVAVAYARISRLTVPWFAALLGGQPVLPLLAAEARPEPAGWAVVLVAVALVDLAVIVALRRRPGNVAGEGAATFPTTLVGGQVAAGLGFAGALLLAAGCALVPLLVGRAGGVPLLAGVPMLLVASAVLGAALLLGGATARAVAAGALVPVLAGALLRPAVELRPSVSLLATALVVVALAGAVRLLPAGWRPGPRIGALLVAGGATALTALTTVALAGVAVGRSVPPWRGATDGPDLAWGWQLPVAAALTSLAVGWLLPRAARPAIVAAGVAVTALAAPATWTSPWPVVVAIDLSVGALLLATAVARPLVRDATATTSALAGAVLLGHGLLVGLAGPAGAGAACAVILAAGLGVAALGRRGGPVQRRVAGYGLLAAVLVVPAGAAVAAIGAGTSPWWQSRAALAAVALPVLVRVLFRADRDDLRPYAHTGLAVSAVLTGLAPVAVPADEPVALYAAVAALLIAVAGFRVRGADPLPLAGYALAAVAVLAAVPVTVRALVTPYGPPPAPWSGVPDTATLPGALPAGLALALLALAAGLSARRGPLLTPPVEEGPPLNIGGWRMAAMALPFTAAAGQVLLVAAAAPWPVVPATALLAGLGLLLTAALSTVPQPLRACGVPVGLVLTAVGLLNLQATRAGTLVGLGLLVVAAATTATAARHPSVRLAGWLATVITATAFAVTAPLAGGLPLRMAAFAVLGVAVVALALAAVAGHRHTADAAPRRGHLANAGVPGHLAGEPGGARSVGGPASPPASVLDAAAQAVALLALLLTVGSAGHAATVCVLWGAAVGVRLLRRGEPAGRRWAFAAVAGGSELFATWLLLVAGGVAVVEAYTVPLASVAIVAGVVALRTRPGLTSWLALAPGLAAVLLPSLAVVLVGTDPQPWRRLLLGAAALAVTLFGAVRRWQAPVVLGGGTLALLALHEVLRGWDLLPRWIYLGVAGLALIGLAASYERRRRDLLRLRAAITRMT
ncbi:hypothetical protein D3H59_17580 [Micromonospora endophytica]|nr:hypothetical protein [Micromonospora endophytica]RIW44504.1 hypothetical protein D3H59_17580 [Micromonospora endophytica]